MTHILRIHPRDQSFLLLVTSCLMLLPEGKTRPATKKEPDDVADRVAPPYTGNSSDRFRKSLVL